MQNYNSKFKIKNPLSPSPYSLSPTSGFTLVELLVVIGVVALILGVVFPNFMGARQRARDAQRKSELGQIQKALELYKLDQNPPAYPTTGAFPQSICNACWDSAGDCSGNIYMRKFPCDPGGSGVSTYIYERDTTDNLKYSLSACLENPVDPDLDVVPEPTCVAAGTSASYTVNEP